MIPSTFSSKVDSVDSYSVVDTVFVSNLDSAKILYEEANSLMDESKIETQIRLDSAVSKLAQSEKDLDAITFEMLIPFAEQNIQSWKDLIIKEKSNIAFEDSMLAVGNNELDFIESARKSAVGDKAYYQILTDVKGRQHLVSISPKYKVIRVE